MDPSLAGESEPVDDFAEVEAMAFVERLYNGAAPIDDTPGYIYLTKTRGLPLRPEDQAQLRWIADYRGDEGALLAPVTDDEGKLVKLLVTYVTLDGRKSPHGSGRSRSAARRGRAFIASGRRVRMWSRRKGWRRAWRRARPARNTSSSLAACPISARFRFRR